MKRKKPLQSSGGRPSAGPDMDQIELLLKTMAEHNLEEFEYSRGDLRIRLKKPSVEWRSRRHECWRRLKLL